MKVLMTSQFNSLILVYSAALSAGRALDLVEFPELDAFVAEVDLEDLPIALDEELLKPPSLAQDRGGDLLGYQEAELEAELRVGDSEDRLLVAPPCP